MIDPVIFVLASGHSSGVSTASGRSRTRTCHNPVVPSTRRTPSRRGPIPGLAFYSVYVDTHEQLEAVVSQLQSVLIARAPTAGRRRTRRTVAS